MLLLAEFKSKKKLQCINKNLINKIRCFLKRNFRFGGREAVEERNICLKEVFLGSQLHTDRIYNILSVKKKKKTVMLLLFSVGIMVKFPGRRRRPC